MPENMDRYIFREHPQEGDYPLLGVDYASHLVLSPVLPGRDTEFIKEYEDVRPKILEILNQTGAGPSWFLIGVCIRPEPQLQKEPLIIPSIILYCSNPQRCYELLKTLNTKLRLEVRRGGASFYYGTPEEPINPQYQDRPDMGCSLGVRGIESSGTFGGFVFQTDSKEIFGLTNAHVTMMNMKKAKDKLPVRIQDVENIQMVQNSDRDHHMILKEAIEDLQKQVTKNDMYSGIRPHTTFLMNKAKKKVDQLNDLKRGFATVISSELAIVDNEYDTKSWIDIGLLKIFENRLGCSDFMRGNSTLKVSGHTEIVPGMKVVKAQGRTTGTQEGIVNGIMGDCRIKCQILCDEPTLSTREWVVLPQEKSGAQISARGDSGSYFVTSSGIRREVVAVLFAGSYVSWKETTSSGCKVPESITKINRDGIEGPLYGAEITIVTPATRILKYLAKEHGVNFEFGEVW